MSRFVCVDGEGVTINDVHTYVMVCDSDGRSLVNPNGISSVDCFEFLLSARQDFREYDKKDKNAVLCGFAIDYDITMMLKDVPDGVVTRLWNDGTVSWGSYRLKYVPRRFLQVTNVSSGRSRRFNNVWGFFQGSFIAALESWKVGAPALIADMKSRRDRFDLTNLDEMLEYCLEECRLTSELMDRLAEALTDAKLPVTHWYGAGSIAASLLRRENVRDYMPSHDSLSADLDSVVRRAYFGGRIEACQVGVATNVHTYDLVSAYPSMMVNLPDSRGRWRQVTRYDASAPFAMWHVSWDLPTDLHITPFPVRRDKCIFYPPHGEGWYHAIEVSAAKAIYGSGICVHGGYVFSPETTCKPFDFVPRVFSERAKLKAEGNAAEKCLKLGLNSLYGKLAQGQSGYGVPAFRSMFWAGMVTAGTRARMLQLAAESPHNVISFATDGLTTDARLDAGMGTGLGSWESGGYDQFLMCQPGIYQGVKDDKVTARSRGLRPREIDFASVRKGWETIGFRHREVIRSRRFVGLGLALAMRWVARRGTWEDAKRLMSLMPSRRWPSADDIWRAPGDGLIHTRPMTFKPHDRRISEPFELRGWSDRPDVVAGSQPFTIGGE